MSGLDPYRKHYVFENGQYYVDLNKIATIYCEENRDVCDGKTYEDLSNDAKCEMTRRAVTFISEEDRRERQEKEYKHKKQNYLRGAVGLGFLYLGCWFFNLV